MEDLQNSNEIRIDTQPISISSDHPITGVYNFYDPETKVLIKRACYLDNKLHGPLLMYNPKGYIEKKFEFYEGVLQGITEFYKDDNLYASLPFDKGLLDGIASYYNPGGDRIMDISFVNGQMEGDLIFYASLGYVNKIIPYLKGKKNGIAKSYYPSGAIAKTEPFLDNLLDGDVTQYYENGQVCSWRFYDKGKLMEGPRIFNLNSQEMIQKSA